MIDEKEIEALARQFCIACGLDPDEMVNLSDDATSTRMERSVDLVSTLPRWMRFRSIAFDRLAMDRAVAALGEVK